MSRRTRLLVAAGVGALVSVAIVAGLALALSRERRLDRQASRWRDPADKIAELHRLAASGQLKLLGSSSVEMAFIEAGFPPRRPVPPLAPRARLKGGAVDEVAGAPAALALYGSDAGPLSVLTLKPSPDLPPADAARVVRGGQALFMLRRDEVSLALWHAGNWDGAVAGAMREEELAALAGLVRQVQDR